MHRKTLLLLALGVTLASGAWAQDVTTGDLECLPNEWNALLAASIDPDIQASDQARLYFRRLNPTGAYYWVELNPSGNGEYWVVFPKPEDRRQQQLTDEWFDLLEHRDWMEGHDREWLEDWLDSQDHEAAEYFIAVVDTAGEEISRTKTMLVPVQDRDECPVALDPYQAGQAANLAIGETTEAQNGREVYHWLCDGIVTRIDYENIMSADEICRACVVATWLPVVPASAALIAGTTIEKREPRRVSDPLP